MFLDEVKGKGSLTLLQKEVFMEKFAKIDRRKIPLSGDRLVDWFFKRLLDVYEREVTKIRKKKRLIDPDVGVREVLRGLLILDSGEIFLNPAKTVNTRNPGGVTSSFIHEESHILMARVYEKHILQLEEILWIRFTDAQKRFLRKLIPKHEVKKGPMSESVAKK